MPRNLSTVSNHTKTHSSEVPEVQKGSDLLRVVWLSKWQKGNTAGCHLDFTASSGAVCKCGFFLSQAQ